MTMSYIIQFYDGTSITINDQQGEAVNRGIDGGAEWIKFGEDRYKVSDMRRIRKSNTDIIKDYRTLGLPDLAIPDHMEDAYAKRTISIPDSNTKRLGE